MHPDDLEMLERTTFEMVVQALTDYKKQASMIFRKERDDVKDIAEDVTREAIEAMGMSGFHERLYGKVDYKKAIYVFVPHAEPVALMLDAKAEQSNGSATIQMSQTSMTVQYLNKSSGASVCERGKLLQKINQGGRLLQVVSVVAKYHYKERNNGGYDLNEIIAACIPNGALQNRYNPNPQDTIWRAGRHSPKRGEEFRVRLNFSRLEEKAAWRVRHIPVKG